MPDRLTITIKRNVLFQGEIWPEKLQVNQIHFNMPDIIMARPLPDRYKTKCVVSWRNMP